MRRYLIAEGRTHIAPAFDVYVIRHDSVADERGLNRPGMRRYYEANAFREPFTVYAGLMANGSQIQYDVGKTFPIQTHYDLGIDEFSSATGRAQLDCRTPFCVFVQASHRQGARVFTYVIARDGQALVTVYLPEAEVDGYKAGTLDARQLESDFAETFNRVTDFFPDPRRPSIRPHMP